MLTYAVKLTLIALAFSYAFAQSDRAHGNVDMGKLPPAQPLWRLDVALTKRRGRSPNPHVLSDDSRVFYLQAGQLKAVDAGTGQQLWTFRAEKGTQLKISSGGLFVITRGKVYALEPRTGRVRWTRSKGKDFFGGLYAVDQHALYIAESERLTAIGVRAGRTKWTTRVPFFAPFEPFTVVKDRVFVFTGGGDAMDTRTSMFDARTGRFLGEADTRGPLATVQGRVFFQNDWFPLDYPDDVFVNVYELRTGKPLESRTYSVENRVTGNYSSSKVAIDSRAVYISGGGNIACFPLSAPGGEAKPDFIRVPKAGVTWLAGPYDGTFLLEWQDALWLARQRRENRCTPIELLEQGRKLDSGTLARIKVTGDGMYLGLKNGNFYAVDLQTGETVLRLKTNATFGPSHVAQNTLVVQAGNELLAFALPEELRR